MNNVEYTLLGVFIALLVGIITVSIMVLLDQRNEKKIIKEGIEKGHMEYYLDGMEVKWRWK